MKVFLALGSNLAQPILQINKAFEAIAKLENVTLIERSSLYSSSPLGPQDQDDYVNAVALIDTELSPRDLLTQVQDIERDFGRVKTRRWGERIIDIDIAFYGQESIHLYSPDLVIPHRDALKRDFVLFPCLEVSPNWTLPNGEKLADYKELCDSHSLAKIDASLACS